MNIEEIIQGLQFTIEMFYLDPVSGVRLNSPINDLDAITINSCTAALNVFKKLKLLEDIFNEPT